MKLEYLIIYYIGLSRGRIDYDVMVIPDWLTEANGDAVGLHVTYEEDLT